jgi:hypothetical protein
MFKFVRFFSQRCCSITLLDSPLLEYRLKLDLMLVAFLMGCSSSNPGLLALTSQVAICSTIMWVMLDMYMANVLFIEVYSCSTLFDSVALSSIPLHVEPAGIQHIIYSQGV